jgi:D-glycero-D-manno-heptose 1,7-bisphosphate phosphatase
MGVNSITNSLATRKRAVFLDRDGVINRALVRNGRPYPPVRLTELEILPGVETALLSLRQAGYLLIVVTNQPDVARGALSRQVVEEIHRVLKDQLAIDEIRTCYHDDKDHCTCRKPKPGALVSSALDHEIDLAQSYMVGDRWRDIEAGRLAGCRTIFIDYGYQEAPPEQFDFKVKSLVQATDIILGNSN